MGKNIQAQGTAPQRPRGWFLKETLRKVGWAERGSGCKWGQRSHVRFYREGDWKPAGGLGRAVTSGQALRKSQAAGGWTVWMQLGGGAGVQVRDAGGSGSGSTEGVGRWPNF